MPLGQMVAPAPAAAGVGFSWHRWRGALARYLFCFGLLPNLPFWIAARREGIATPGLISLDGLLLGLAALFVRPAWVIAAFAADFLLDIVYGIRATYSTSYIDIFLSVRYLFTAIARSQLILISATILASVGLIAWAWVSLRPRITGRERTVLVLAVLAVTIPWAAASRRQRLAATDKRLENAQLGFAGGNASSLAFWLANSTRSPALAFYHAWRREDIWGWLAHHGGRAVAPVASAASLALPLLRPGAARPNLVMVLVESWGEADNPALRQSLMAPFAAPGLAVRYRVSSGLVAFDGSTGDGELRELCNLRLLAGTPLAVAPGNLTHCLAWQLDAAGYRTTAMDSATDFWPGGADWYKLLGFQQVIGFDALHQRGLPTFIAGTFRSIRDQEAAATLPGLLAGGRAPQFVFFLTVSAHLPIHLPLPADYDANCAIAPVTRASAAACGWYKVERQTLAAVAAAAARPGLAPTVFLAVGDHAPPFLDGARRRFDPARVPYVLLAPR